MPNINIIFEDNHILVVEKPINIPTQADDSGDSDMLFIIKKYLKEKYEKPGNVFVGLVHRLDRPVGGVMVFAKTSKAASRLSEQIRNHEFKKTYLAVTHGKPAKVKDTLKNFLLKDKDKNISKVADENESDAKEAILDYEVKSSKDGYSLIKVNLHTGRSHQIRVQFANIGNPLYGDQKYGVNINKVGQQIALWANEIEFIHPITKEIIKFHLNPPNIIPWNMFE